MLNYSIGLIPVTKITESKDMHILKAFDMYSQAVIQESCTKFLPPASSGSQLFFKFPRCTR